ARLVTVPFVLLLLYLAWPGWLHGSTEFNSRTRVAWQVRVPPPLQKAAAALKDLKAKGEGNNVFTPDFQLANVLPWFAPEVKCNIDTRFALFADSVATLGKLRDGLYGE